MTLVAVPDNDSDNNSANTMAAIDPGWTDWVVARDSGFWVYNDSGEVEVAQITRKGFRVKTRFKFGHEPTLATYRARLRRRHSAHEAEQMLNDARSIATVPTTTDFASVPGFLGWFERPYGRHTLAAVLHDQLIGDEPNDGALGSDTLADSFFRDMIGAAGVPVLKRWLMWTAVAARTRWAAGGLRRISLVIWTILGVIGAGTSGYMFLAATLGTMAWGAAVTQIAVAFALGVSSSVLWGRQWGAGLVAAFSGVWLIPATLFVLVGLAVYWALERAAR